MKTDTKSALLNSAEWAARQFGFDGFSYADLAEDVGIRKASIHYHFPSKADLSLAMMVRYQESLRAACAEIDRLEPTAGGRLRALIQIYEDALNGGRSLCLCVALSISRDSLSDATLAQMASYRGMMLKWIETVFSTGAADGTIRAVGNPAMEAAAALSLLEGAQLSARVGQDVAVFLAASQILRDRAV